MKIEQIILQNEMRGYIATIAVIDGKAYVSYFLNGTIVNNMDNEEDAKFIQSIEHKLNDICDKNNWLKWSY